MGKQAWDGLCPAGRHGLDYAGQSCDLCPKAPPPDRDAQLEEQLAKEFSHTCAMRDRDSEAENRWDAIVEAAKIGRAQGRAEGNCDECEGWRTVAADAFKALDVYARQIWPELPEHYGMPVDGVRKAIETTDAQLAGYLSGALPGLHETQPSEIHDAIKAYRALATRTEEP